MSFLIPSVTDIIDILLVAVILYRLLIISQKTGGYQILIGIGLIVVIYFVAAALQLSLMTSILRALKDYWILVFIILFQPEIRGVLTKIVRTHDLRLMMKGSLKKQFTPLLNAVSIMSFRKIGALILIEKHQKLDEFIETGEIIDARLSLKLLLAIFNQKSVLHDGAVIVRNDKIYAAKVVLPLSENIEYTKKYGTRHLAALGISEKTDSFAIIVSEESGRISSASNGEITSDLSIDELAQRIKDETA